MQVKQSKLLLVTIGGLLFSSLTSSSAFAVTSAEQALAEKYAPLIGLHPDEKFFPDSVENYIQGSDPNGIHANEYNSVTRLVTQSSLDGKDYSDPNSLPAYLAGDKSGVESNRVPIYSYVKDVAPGVVDILYAAFYPYNLGKTTCAGLEFDLVGFKASADTNVTPSISQNLPTMTLNSSLLCTTNGGSIPLLNAGIASVGLKVGVPNHQLDTTFSNHPTDAEFYVVRLVNGVPTKVMFGAHGVYESHSWNNISKAGGTHAKLYSGKGGHGHHKYTGKRRVLVQETALSESGSWSDGWWEFSLSANYYAGGTVKVYSLDHTHSGGKQWRTWNNVKAFKWQPKTNSNRSDDYSSYFNQFPWLQEYNGVHWGSPKFGDSPAVEFGIDYSVGISERFCIPVTGPCTTLSLMKTGEEVTTMRFSEQEQSGTDGSVKVARADEIFGKASPLLNNLSNVGFKSAHNKWLVAENNGNADVKANRSQKASYESFKIEYLSGSNGSSACVVHGNVVAINTQTGYYLRATNKGKLDARANSIGGWERFTLINHSDSSGCLSNGDVVSLRSSHNRYVVAVNNGNADADRTSIGSWERFTISM